MYIYIYICTYVYACIMYMYVYIQCVSKEKVEKQIWSFTEEGQACCQKISRAEVCSSNSRGTTKLHKNIEAGEEPTKDTMTECSRPFGYTNDIDSLIFFDFLALNH